jgi:antitoxin MazE
MARATLGVWGKTLAVRIPAEIAETSGFGPGQKIEMVGKRGEIVIRPARPSAIERMFAGKTAEAWRELYADADEWGPDVGREIVEP